MSFFDRWRRTPTAAPATQLSIQRSSVAMGDESDPIVLDVSREDLTLRAVLDALTEHYSTGRYGWVSVGRQTTTWVLWLYPAGRFGASIPAAVLTCDPVAVTHVLAPDETRIGPDAVLLLAYRLTEDPDDVAAQPRR